MRATLPALVALAVALSGCYTEADCITLHVFAWDAPGLHDALLEADPVGTLAAVPPGPGVPVPDGVGSPFGEARVAAVRYTDPGGDLRHATAYFGTPPVEARIIVAVPPDDDAPEPLFDLLWDALGFTADRDAARERMLATSGASGAFVTYQTDVAPELDLDAWLAARGGLGGANVTTPGAGAVQATWPDWRMDLAVPVAAWDLGAAEAPHRIQAMPHGPASLLVETSLGWGAADARDWMADFAAAHGLPTEGLSGDGDGGGVRRGPIERVCL